MTEGYDWNSIFEPGTELKIASGGRICASSYFKTPQTVTIVDVSEMRDKDGDWPQALMIRGVPIAETEPRETRLDNIYVRQGIERGGATPR